MNETSSIGWIGRFFGWLLGVDHISPEDMRFSIEWRSDFASIAVFVLAIVTAIVLVVVASRREQSHLSSTKRATLGTLRAIALLILVLMMFMPLVRFTYTEYNKYPLAFAIDATDSMNIKDVRKRQSDLQEAADVLTPNATTEKRRAVEDYFWMLEEYKVSVFAQELKTAIPISAKRLLDKLKQIERMI